MQIYTYHRHWAMIEFGAIIILLFITNIAVSATLSVGSTTVKAGNNTRISVLLSPNTGESISAMQFDLLYEVKAIEITSISAGSSTLMALKQLQYNRLSAGRVRVIIAGLNQNIIPGGSVAEVDLWSCDSAPAGNFSVTLSSTILSSPTGNSIPVSTVSGTISVQRELYHSADQNHDWKFSLTEVLRVIQLYNSSQFYCSCVDEDGYGITGGSRDCVPHSSDYYGTPNWRIQLYEILRLIQFYNFGGYHPASGTEDGFTLGSL